MASDVICFFEQVCWLQRVCSSSVHIFGASTPYKPSDAIPSIMDGIKLTAARANFLSFYGERESIIFRANRRLEPE